MTYDGRRRREKKSPLDNAGTELVFLEDTRTAGFARLVIALSRLGRLRGRAAVAAAFQHASGRTSRIPDPVDGAARATYTDGVVVVGLGQRRNNRRRRRPIRRIPVFESYCNERARHALPSMAAAITLRARFGPGA